MSHNQVRRTLIWGLCCSVTVAGLGCSHSWTGPLLLWDRAGHWPSGERARPDALHDRPVKPPAKPVDASDESDDRHPSRWRRKLKARFAMTPRDPSVANECGSLVSAE